MKVFKFGGASIKDAQSIKNIVQILGDYKNEKLLLVVSALGKTTNALEQVANTYLANDLLKAKELFALLEAEHNALAQELMGTNATTCIAKLTDIYHEADWILHDAPTRTDAYYYDQLVCLGELMSTVLVHHYIQDQYHNCHWQDVRDIVRTDDTYKEATIDWQATQDNVHKIIVPLFAQTNFVITQGFIGCTTDNESTTLGREGSDYTGAVFANMLDAQSLTIWKDVKGLLSGDPKIFADVVPIPTISYYEVIEMSFYGAQVIHPKTIKPLQNKNIPLFVKCFEDKNIAGTSIVAETQNIMYPPILVLKKDQVLLQIKTKDYSFITEEKLSDIYEILHALKIKINVIQNAAISFVACIDANNSKVEQLYTALAPHYDLRRNDHVELLTIRHYTPAFVEKYTQHKTIILEQKSRHTVQLIMKDNG